MAGSCKKLSLCVTSIGTRKLCKSLALRRGQLFTCKSILTARKQTVLLPHGWRLLKPNATSVPREPVQTLIKQNERKHSSFHSLRTRALLNAAEFERGLPQHCSPSDGPFRYSLRGCLYRTGKTWSSDCSQKVPTSEPWWKTVWPPPARRLTSFLASLVLDTLQRFVLQAPSTRCCLLLPGAQSTAPGGGSLSCKGFAKHLDTVWQTAASMLALFCLEEDSNPETVLCLSCFPLPQASASRSPHNASKCK